MTGHGVDGLDVAAVALGGPGIDEDDVVREQAGDQGVAVDRAGPAVAERQPAGAGTREPRP